jgi:hypothetical protein
MEYRLISGKVKGKAHLRTDYEVPEGSRGTVVLFL